jgi:tripartite-type tricarboxylate transporter receptor subunit TctC
MKLPRRRFLQLAAGAAALPAVSRTARADTYPSRPVHIIVGYAAGGPTDLVARLMGQWLSERFGQQFIIENRPGAGSNIAAETVVRAAPDGYTLLELTNASAVNVTLYKNLNFNLIHDVTPVAGNVRGSAADIYGALFKMMAGVDLVTVAYRGAAPALIDLIGGQVQVMFDPLSSSIEHIKTGRLRPLAVTTATRLEVLPDIPTVGDFVPGYEASSWNGIAAPKNTPAEIVDKLNKEINAALADPKMKARLAEFGGIVLAGSPSDFGRLIADETEKWAKVIKYSGMKSD